MMKYLRKFVDSSKELGTVSGLAVCAMMLALRVVLGMFANISLAFLPLPVVKFSLTFIPIILTAYLFGPVCAGIVAGAGDVLSYFLAPTALPFTPGITACYVLEGIIYGTVLYHEELTLPRSIAAKALDLVFCTLSLNSVVLWFIYFSTQPLYYVILLRAAVLVPIAILEVSLLMVLKKPLLTIQKKRK